MPVATHEIKWKSVKRLGANVVLVGDAYDEAQANAKKRAEEESRMFIPPFDHSDVIARQGTIGMEINCQLKDKIHVICVFQILSNQKTVNKRRINNTQIYSGSPSMRELRPLCRCRFYYNQIWSLSLQFSLNLLLDLKERKRPPNGVAVKVVGEETFRLCKELVDGVVLVNRDAICASIKDMFEEKRSILEPAGALALALAGAEAYCKYYDLKDENVVAITSGANMNFDKLILISELADVGRKSEAVLATFMGSFKWFCEQVRPTMKFTEFNYRYSSSNEKALVFDLLTRLALRTKSELEALIERMRSAQLHTINLTDNDLVNDHLRHLMGGRSDLNNELLCRFTLPEKAGALSKCLDAFSPCWNISLIHYRAQARQQFDLFLIFVFEKGQIGANILVGIQVPQDEFDEFQGRARGLGYEYVVESLNDAFKLIMH
ncbi:hypothetical protein K7X08_037797 [Anisodus acutangulus]|uniref:threonine ammonia-lyase n=1 Tax=Anisodus acutangulus TaxID=402998 RepID=A0A9Q1RTL2_9SOLA|nr:hypothetical protein K7X08_037797 [Anisodus acutangulus]